MMAATSKTGHPTALEAFARRHHFRALEVAEHDPAKRLRSREFWYRAVHHIVQFRDGVFPTEDVPVRPRAYRQDLRAEVQVRGTRHLGPAPAVGEDGVRPRSVQPIARPVELEPWLRSDEVQDDPEGVLRGNGAPRFFDRDQDSGR